MTTLNELAGTSWTGENRLWVSPNEPARESSTSATIEPAARDQGLVIRNWWSDSGEPHAGTLLVQVDSRTGEATAAWTDSWHQRESLLNLRGKVEPNGRLFVQGAYAAPPGPDWGWQIAIDIQSPEAFVLQMFNVTPEGQAMPAVEARFSRDVP